MENRLWYKTPAERFSEALPIGNGSFGAMVYGNYPLFQYSLNADTLWSGTPERKTSWKVSEENVREVRRLLREEKYFEAEQIVQNKMTSDYYNESYVSAGFLNIRFEDEKMTDGFSRALSLEDAAARSVFEIKGNKIQTESYWSYEDEVLVTLISSEKPISLQVKQKSLLRHEAKSSGTTLILCGEAPSHVEPNYAYSKNPILYEGNSIKFCIASTVSSNGNSYTEEINEEEKKNSLLHVEQATQIRILTAMETGYQGYGKKLEEKIESIVSLCLKKMEKAGRFDEFVLYERHVQKYRPLFERVQFCLPAGKAEALPTDERLRRCRDLPEEDPGLYSLLYQYGRYLMLCSSYPSREDTQPANLQGLWCEDIRPMWSCNNTININTEMNYWLSGPAALPECEKPLIQMVTEASVSGEETARDTFGCGGWAACHNIDLWRQTTPVRGNVKWSYWPMGGVWLTTHLYRHFLYSGDTNNLRKTGYPLMKKTVQFCLDWLEEEDGKLHSAPSTSPENTFLDAFGRECAISDSSTMDITLIREILQETYEAGILLGEKESYLEELKSSWERLPDFQTGAYGQLLEWSKDFVEADPHHRHLAHLVAVHPFHQIRTDHRRELLEAARKTIERRTKDSRVFIGWVEAWLVNFSARMQDSEEAFRHLNLFLSACAYDNLFSLHPPLGETDGEKEIFQIDGNFGVAAGISEMLVYSRPKVIRFLPALPKVWREGKLRGVLVCGGHEVNLRWSHGRMEEATVRGKKKETVTLCNLHPFQWIDEDGTCVPAIERDGEFQIEVTLEPERVCRIQPFKEKEQEDSNGDL